MPPAWAPTGRCGSRTRRATWPARTRRATCSGSSWSCGWPRRWATATRRAPSPSRAAATPPSPPPSSPGRRDGSCGCSSPTSADAAVVDRLRTLGARVVTCPRRPGEAGDPSYLRLQEALAQGAVPFTCQGPDNGLAIEGGSTLAWEIADELRAAGATLDRIVVQVGGGALASGIALGFDDAAAIGAIETVPTLDTVQARGGAPLARAYERVLADLGLVAGTPADPSVVHDGLRRVADRRSRYMWPWETEPVSVAHGILDDETYDWLAVVRAMLVTGGRAVVVDEPALLRGQRARLRRHRHRCRRDGHRRRGRPARARRAGHPEARQIHRGRPQRRPPCPSTSPPREETR